MQWDEIARLIAQLGFPIFVAVFLLVERYKFMHVLIENLGEIRECLKELQQLHRQR